MNSLQAGLGRKESREHRALARSSLLRDWFPCPRALGGARSQEATPGWGGADSRPEPLGCPRQAPSPARRAMTLPTPHSHPRPITLLAPWHSGRAWAFSGGQFAWHMIPPSLHFRGEPGTLRLPSLGPVCPGEQALCLPAVLVNLSKAVRTHGELFPNTTECQPQKSLQRLGWDFCTQ